MSSRPANSRLIFLPALSLLAAWFMSEIVLKPMFAYPRPVGAMAKGFSFPSTHATIAFALAVVLSAMKPSLKLFFYGFAVVVSLSRVYVGDHFPLDVVAGGVLGCAIGSLVAKRGLPEKSAKHRK